MSGFHHRQNWVCMLVHGTFLAFLNSIYSIDIVTKVSFSSYLNINLKYGHTMLCYDAT